MAIGRLYEGTLMARTARADRWQRMAGRPTSPTSRLVVLLFAAALSAVGCSSLLNSITSSSTAPTPTGVNALNGTWASVSSATQLTDTCTNFEWTVSAISGNTGSGAFTATCRGTLLVTGTAQGVVTDTKIAWTATGVAPVSGQADCAVTLSGSAVFEPTTQIRVPFTGTTCQGPVTGTEILRQ
jgi:hypothetical protein